MPATVCTSSRLTPSARSGSFFKTGEDDAVAEDDDEEEEEDEDAPSEARSK